MVKERTFASNGADVPAESSASFLASSYAKHKFAPPPSLSRTSSTNVWKTIQDELQSSKRTFEEEGTTAEKAKESPKMGRIPRYRRAAGPVAW